MPEQPDMIGPNLRRALEAERRDLRFVVPPRVKLHGGERPTPLERLADAEGQPLRALHLVETDAEETPDHEHEPDRD